MLFPIAHFFYQVQHQLPTVIDKLNLDVLPFYLSFESKTTHKDEFHSLYGLVSYWYGVLFFWNAIGMNMQITISHTLVYTPVNNPVHNI